MEIGKIGFGPAHAGLTDEQIRDLHAKKVGLLQSATIGNEYAGGATYDRTPELRERVIHMLIKDHDNTASLLQAADRIVKFIQTGDKDAK
jgi:hypothetical protein